MLTTNSVGTARRAPDRPGVTRNPVPGVPDWVRQMDMPVWVTGPDGTLRWLNRKAERVLGVRAADCVGRPCHEAVRARDAEGRAICGPTCRMAERAARGQALAPCDAEVGRAGPRARWTRWTVIPVASGAIGGRGGAPWLVHAATDLGHARECTEYVERLAARSAALRETDPSFAPRRLSARESEILGLLANDRGQGEIARELGISPATVRNHVQRLTAAIGAHSVQEAIALHLLAPAATNNQPPPATGATAVAG